MEYLNLLKVFPIHKYGFESYLKKQKIYTY